MPHVVPRSAGPRRKVVVVGAGPAGLEAARVAAERGHEVVLFEATEKAGGQILLAVRAPRRRELIGIVDWRVAQLERLGVDMRFATYADAAEVLAQAPDIVFIATGGVPEHRRPGRRQRSRHLLLGRALRPGEARRPGAGVRRQRRRIPACRRPS